MKNTFAELAAQLKSIQERVQQGAPIPSLRGEIDTLHAECKSAKYEEGIARSERYAAALLDLEGKIDDALKLNAKVKRFAKKNGVGDLERECVFYECVVMLRSGDTTKAYKNVHALYNEAEREADSYMIAQAGLLLGIIVKQNGLDDEALGWFKRTLELSKSEGFFGIQFNVLMHLSEMFLSKLKYRYAEQYARESLTIGKMIGQDQILLRATVRLLTVLIENGGLTESTKLLKAVESKKQLLSGPNVGTYYLCAGKLLAKKHKYIEAETELKTAIDVFHSFKRDRLIANTYGILAELYLEQKKADEALDAVCKMDDMSQAINDSYQTMQASRLYYQAYKLSGDALKALEYLERYNTKMQEEENKLLDTRIEFIELQKDYEMKQAEAETERQRSHILQIELEHKEKELTEKTRHLIKQTDALTQFRDDLRSIIRRSPSDDPLVKEIKERLKEVPESQLKWEVFDEQFRLVHPVFLKKLLEKHPTLTKMEQKICTLLRLNMTSVDIAKLLYLSERNIENHRYRIRKKISLNSEMSLHEYLAGV